MKYLRLFTESNTIPDERDEIIEYCKDILMHLKDDEFKIDITIGLDNCLVVVIERDKDFAISSFKDELRMLSSYLKSLGFIFNQQQKSHPGRNRWGYYANNPEKYKFSFSYIKEEEISESIYDKYDLEYDENDDEELLEIKSVFVDIIADEFELEKYTDNIDSNGIYYEIERDIERDNYERILIYLYVIDSGDEDSIEWERFMKMHKHFKQLEDRLNAMKYDCDYHEDIRDCGENIAEQGYTIIEVSKFSNANESIISDFDFQLPQSNRYKTVKGEISLLHPSKFTMDMYEICCIEGDFFDDIERYYTLEEAEARIDELIDWFQIID